MKLKIKRSQKASMMGNVVFCLDIMADLTREEAELIRRYKLEKQIVYATPESQAHLQAAVAGSVKGLGSFLLDRMTKRTLIVKDLVDGQHIECKDLGELLATEEQVHEGCTNLNRYLAVAAKFNGTEEIVTVAA